MNGGELLNSIVTLRLSNAADQLRRRLAIDQLRVALSRPTERLIWIDADPAPISGYRNWRSTLKRATTPFWPSTSCRRFSLPWASQTPTSAAANWNSGLYRFS